MSLNDNVSQTGWFPQRQCHTPSRMCKVTAPMLKSHSGTDLLSKSFVSLAHFKEHTWTFRGLRSEGENMKRLSPHPASSAGGPAGCRRPPAIPPAPPPETLLTTSSLGGGRGGGRRCVVGGGVEWEDGGDGEKRGRRREGGRTNRRGRRRGEEGGEGHNLK